MSGHGLQNVKASIKVTRRHFILWRKKSEVGFEVVPVATFSFGQCFGQGQYRFDKNVNKTQKAVLIGTLNADRIALSYIHLL